MTLTLYMHPLASFCHKVLIALYENDVAFEPVTVDLGDPGEVAALLAKWPVGKIPVLHDTMHDRIVPETSIIIEYLQQHHAGPVPLLPTDRDGQLDIRLWDRFYDLYVSVPVQKIVTDRIRPNGATDPKGLADAHATLDIAYATAETRLAGSRWAAGDAFSLADCAAAPALFYASIVHPFGDRHQNLAAYFERLLERPSVKRTINEARPYFSMFPYRDAMPERFLRE